MVCQLCNKPRHVVINCYHQFDHNFQGASSTGSFSQPITIANYAALYAGPETLCDTAWYPDSGTSNHITSSSSNLMQKNEFAGPDQVYIGNGKGFNVKHIGKSVFQYLFSPQHTLYLNHLLHVPQITQNLISVSKFARDNYVYFEFHPNKCFVRCQGTNQVILKGQINSEGLYCFNDLKLHNFSSPSSGLHKRQQQSQTHVLVSSNNTCTPFDLWHYRLGHSNAQVVRKVLSTCNLNFSSFNSSKLCSACMKGKAHSLPYFQSTSVYTKPL